ncbi:hypothetical protein BCV71DRAFT_46311 [Rhizopus microsporus]|uniref:Calponin-homology (CH) domain-containing protein n=1 Tax=Rhizopus microsporus TaxID=58291 RepID=A0A1X0SGF7_RHIZD|nr:hypothetical protein BCV71DRAFT_46311 [Rhizopus microsporus]
MDSIFGDVHMGKVKFETKHEYEYVSNYKILQHTFDKHKIDKIIPVDKLLKCKFQDNLEFMQWMKRFWDQNFPGGDYDALGRRKGGGVKTTTTSSPASRTARTKSSAAPEPQHVQTLSFHPLDDQEPQGHQIRASFKI